jgi:adenylate kinase family enzyme
MRRVMIIGGSGSGKSTFAREIGLRTGLPVAHMDRLFWEPGWVEADKMVFLRRVEDAVATESWVMDGNYSRTWPGRIDRADTLIFLDLPTWLRLWRVLRRTVLNYGKSRYDLGEDCPERFDLCLIFGWVTRYHRNSRPKALALMAPDEPAAHLARFHLRSRRSVKKFLDDLGIHRTLLRLAS